MDGGRPARRPPRFAPSGKGEQYLQGGARQSTPPLARAGRLLQRRGDKRYTRRGQTFRSPGRETRFRALDNSMQALRQVARLPRNSCGRGMSNTAQNKRRRRRDPTPHRTGTYALIAVQRAAPQPSVQGVCLEGVLKLQVGGAHPERMYQGLRPRMKVELRREFARAARPDWGVIGGGRFGLTCAAGFRVSCSLVGVCILWE